MLNGSGRMNEHTPDVLIVEDDLAMAELVSEELADSGVSTRAVPNGKEAMEAIRARKPDLVVLDLVLPERDGIETLNRIFNGRHDLPVVVHTAHAGYRDNYLTWPADEFVVKQSDFAPLVTAVHRHLPDGP